MMISAAFRVRHALLLTGLVFLVALVYVFLKMHAHRLSYDLAEKEERYRQLMDEKRILQAQVVQASAPARLMARAHDLQMDFVRLDKPAQPPQVARTSRAGVVNVNVNGRRQRPSR